MHSAILEPRTNLREMLQAYLILLRIHVVLLGAMLWTIGSDRRVEWPTAAEPAGGADYAQSIER